MKLPKTSFSLRKSDAITPFDTFVERSAAFVARQHINIMLVACELQDGFLLVVIAGNTKANSGLIATYSLLQRKYRCVGSYFLKNIIFDINIELFHASNLLFKFANFLGRRSSLLIGKLELLDEDGMTLSHITHRLKQFRDPLFHNLVVNGLCTYEPPEGLNGIQHRVYGTGYLLSRFQKTKSSQSNTPSKSVQEEIRS